MAEYIVAVDQVTDDAVPGPIRLADAWCCLDCEVLFTSFERCPSCAGSAIWPVAAWVSPTLPHLAVAPAPAGASPTLVSSDLRRVRRDIPSSWPEEGPLHRHHDEQTTQLRLTTQRLCDIEKDVGDVKPQTSRQDDLSGSSPFERSAAVETPPGS